VRFVPLIGEQGWQEAPGAVGEPQPRLGRQARPPRLRLPERIARVAEAFESIEQANLDSLLERIGDARVVLLGEATHGTSEFYRMRARITQALIERKGFSMVAVEADWPDAGRIDHYVRHRETAPAEMEGVYPLPGMDVAQRGSRRIRRVATKSPALQRPTPKTKISPLVTAIATSARTIMQSAACIMVDGRATTAVKAPRPMAASASARRTMLIEALPSRLFTSRPARYVLVCVDRRKRDAGFGRSRSATGCTEVCRRCSGDTKGSPSCRSAASTIVLFRCGRKDACRAGG
jgi:hypothetical protein